MSFHLKAVQVASTAMVLGASLAPGPAAACSCVCSEQQSLADQFEAASAVVVAEVIKRQPVESVDQEGRTWVSSCGQETVRLRILSSFKGASSGEVLARHSDLGTACDLDFELKVGKRYVLFLRDSFEIDGCGASSPLRRSSKLRDQLDELAKGE